MRIKQRKIIIPAVTAILVIVSLAAWFSMKGPDLSDPVALVNGATITFQELQREIKKIQDGYAMQNIFPDKAELEQLKKEVLEHLIEREVLWQEAGRQNMVVSDGVVSAELEARKKQFGNEAILNNMLANWKMSLHEYLGLIKRDLTVEALIKREIGGAIDISDAACEAYYRSNPKKFEAPEQIRVSHIAIFAYEDAPEAEKQKAEAAIQTLEHRLNQGEVFEDLAREASQCASSQRGGDLGFIARGAMDPKFEKAAFAMKPNVVSPIVRSSVGYHIIKVTDRKPAQVVPFDEVKVAIAQQLRDQEIDSGLRTYLRELMKQADVKRLL